MMIMSDLRNMNYCMMYTYVYTYISFVSPSGGEKEKEGRRGEEEERDESREDGGV